ncbi:MAG: hypothetical protein ABEI98_08360 [Halorhabdus sp.]|jgi:hypothetical protein
MVQLREIAHARSGDKGNVSNIGVIARDPAYYDVIEKHVTADRVADHFQELCDGPVTRYEMPNIDAFNFVLEDALGGGGMSATRLDSLGKTHSGAILRMEIDAEIPEGNE